VNAIVTQPAGLSIAHNSSATGNLTKDEVTMSEDTRKNSTRLVHSATADRCDCVRLAAEA
jgi:hypothetical protein